MIVIPKAIEVEITTKCTLFCPMCARTLDPDEIFQKWKQQEMSVELFERFLSNLDKNTHLISFCSAFGDAIYHTKLEEIFKLCKQYDKSIDLYTNGSYRTKEWWETISNILTERDNITFSVDGLENSNKVYRVNSDWKSIITGMTVIGKNKLVHKKWKWILFKQNQHEVLDGYRLSKELGIDEFIIVNSGRCQDDMMPTVDYNELISELKRLQDK